MRIIKKNKKHLWIECERCGSILQPEEKDIQVNIDKYRGPDDIEIEPYKNLVHIIKNTRRWFDCPVCGTCNVKDVKTEEYYISEDDFFTGKWK